MITSKTAKELISVLGKCFIQEDYKSAELWVQKALDFERQRTLRECERIAYADNKSGEGAFIAQKIQDLKMN